MELQGGVSAVVAMGGPDAARGDGGVRAYLAGTERGVIFHVELSQGQGRAAPMLESHFEPVRLTLTPTLTLTLTLTPAHTRPTHAPHTPRPLIHPCTPLAGLAPPAAWRPPPCTLPHRAPHPSPCAASLTDRAPHPSTPHRPCAAPLAR